MRGPSGLLLLVVVAACLHSCVAWWQTGHMLVAQIGYNYLLQSESAETRHALLNALDALQTYSNQSDTFVTSACWMDDLKTRSLNQFNTWHYINIPYCTDNVTFCENNPISSVLSGTDNVVWAINNAMSTLTSKAAGGFERGFSVRNLLHLVGDIHQPLHCVALYSAKIPGGDQGGNKFWITNVTGASNLHALWDGGVGLLNNDISRPLTKEGNQYIVQLAQEIMAELNVTAINTTSSIADWAMEGLALAQTVVYNITYGGTPSPDYYKIAQPVVRQQLGKAGYRLAFLLKQIALCSSSSGNCPTEKKTEDERNVYFVITAILCAGLVLSIIINVVIVHKYKIKHTRAESAPLLQ